MADDLIPPTPPQDGGNKTPANNKAGGKINRQPKKKLKPRNPGNGKESSFTFTQVVECGGMAGILMIWFEIIDCHDLWKLVVAGLALLVLYAGFCHFIYHFVKKKSWAVRLALAIWVVFSVLTGLFVLKHSRSEPKPYPHLTFSLQADIDPENSIELTNSLLVVSNFQTVTPLSPMVLFVPHHTEREAIGLQFIVENNGPIDAENLSVAVGISDEFSCIADSAWEPTSPVSIVAINTNRYMLTSWGFRVPPIHPGDSFRLPMIQIKNPPILDPKNPLKPVLGSFAILARAKESPAQSINGFLCFVPCFTNAFFKPFLLPWKYDSNGLMQTEFDMRTNGGLIR